MASLANHLRPSLNLLDQPPIPGAPMSTVLDFNRANLSEQSVSTLINQLIEQAEPPGDNTRQYLGASAMGSECLRKIQYDWMCEAQFRARTRDIFDRGHWGEDLSRRHLAAAGFQFAPPERLEFIAVDGLFRGHADGILTSGPQIPALRYPCIWEHKASKRKAGKQSSVTGFPGFMRPMPVR